MTVYHSYSSTGMTVMAEGHQLCKLQQLHITWNVRTQPRATPFSCITSLIKWYQDTLEFNHDTKFNRKNGTMLLHKESMSNLLWLYQMANGKVMMANIHCRCDKRHLIPTVHISLEFVKISSGLILHLARHRSPSSLKIGITISSRYYITFWGEVYLEAKSHTFGNCDFLNLNRYKLQTMYGPPFHTFRLRGTLHDNVLSTPICKHPTTITV